MTDLRAAAELSMRDISVGRVSSRTRNAPPLDPASASQILASFTGAPTASHRQRNKRAAPAAHETDRTQHTVQSKQKQTQLEMCSHQSKQ